jgi:hypothetical protein
MRVARLIYAALAALAIMAAIVVPWLIYRSGVPGLPAWATVASPGPLSSAHAFLGQQCEACHTPNRGIEAASCISCHSTAASVLAMQSTVFHADVQECRGCHFEHRGLTARPTAMDHTVLSRIGWARETGNVDAAAISETSHFLATVAGKHEADDTQRLDCFSCHSNRNAHRDGTAVSCCGPGSPNSVGSLFGRECADCHSTSTWKIAGYKHPSPRSQDCAQCHQPPPSHSMMHFSMVSMQVAGQMHARVEQCYLCHQPDAWNDIKGVGWYKHH